MYPDVDQLIRAEERTAIIKVGDKDCLDIQYYLSAGDAIFVLRGKWHNIQDIECRRLPQRKRIRCLKGNTVGPSTALRHSKV